MKFAWKFSLLPLSLPQRTLSDPDDSPLINLCGLTRKKLRITRGKSIVVDGPKGSHPDKVARLISKVEEVVAQSKGVIHSSAPTNSLGTTVLNSDTPGSKRFTQSQAAKALAELSTSRKRRRSHASSSSDEDSVPEDQPLSPKGGNSDSSLFRSALHRGLWAFVSVRKVRREHSLPPSRVQGLHILELISDLGLSKTVINVPSYVLSVVREFYANLSRSISDLSSEHFYKTFIRGHWIDFSPSVINQ